MGRRLRKCAGGVVYHVRNRRAGRGRLFFDDGYAAFEKARAEALARFPGEVRKVAATNGTSNSLTHFFHRPYVELASLLRRAASSPDNHAWGLGPCGADAFGGNGPRSEWAETPA